MDWSLFFIFFLGCCAAASTGALFQPGDWYDGLDKPAWTPPDWVFPVTWTVLYISMAIAAARVAVLDGSAHAMAFFAAQLAFNTLWTPIFFGLHRMGAGMIVILCLWATVAATMLAFFALDTLAGALFVPYLIWVTIASALNFSVWRRNN
ncbi:sensory protein TspO [Alphaproteobacteria bacterium GH1-50]|uniref:Sensory protein TspO n=1 Tax=Kangsaoukella pontilimi TaxID=2691042 RepID=A0A7C9N353_9RHOB|nr:TspO/MBR family protein [Kangsaoukella pontilimi]MXQ09758.1 sensory protein TspO [Kangsaoukella pontilimi]